MIKRGLSVCIIPWDVKSYNQDKKPWCTGNERSSDVIMLTITRPRGQLVRINRSPARRVNANPSARLLKTNWKMGYLVSESTRTSEMSMDLRVVITVFADLSNAWGAD